jgi:ureidoglycolate lyase
MNNVPRTLRIEPLRSESFSAFGEVIEASETAHHFTINGGFAERFHDLAKLDVSHEGGRAIVNIFRARPRPMPFQLQVMERHPLGSQAFVSMTGMSFLVVVAPAAEALEVNDIRCFLAKPGQGVNYARGTWHHPLIAVTQAADFLVIDRAGSIADSNLDEVDVRASSIWVNHKEQK